MKNIPPRYNPKECEQSIYSKWENDGFFRAEPQASKKPFTIVIPPPNVTGILHMGHALNNTLQDILIRWKRMQGKASLWVPGTDHAGIATQNVVERSLRKKNISRQQLGREKFVEEVWKWRKEYGNAIISQLKRLGSSCDWQRTRFTMDKGLSDAVLEAFAQLYEKGLIYRGNYIINWCPRCQTALSDEEAPHVDAEGKLYYIRYPFRPGHGSRVTGHGVIVATTRPETMLGDVAVAVNPKDKRYKKLVGEKLILPLIEREIEIIADDFVDKKFGTGAVKVTPAHDPNDFEISKRHDLEPLKVIAPDGKMNENAGYFSGMDRFEAREAVLKELAEKQLLVKTEAHQHAVGHCYRCHSAVEPYLSLQWFVKMKPLAKPAIDAVKKGKIKFYPKRWTKVYLNWMENIRDWCISRQIWWGHRIPVYYCAEEHVIVSKARPEKCPTCGSAEIRQDDDVLDTWFSSWLWPFSTLGWPEKTEDLKYFYPTSVLVTAPEILFFWVARMIMSGMEFIKKIPFEHVYIHGTVRDLTGKKMSKSLGNVIDPIDIIDEFGADALRYSIIAITSTGQDVFLSKEKFQLGRNFANKIWNASRFVLMNIPSSSPLPNGERERVRGDLSLADQWILSKLNKTIAAVTKALENYRFSEAESLVYEFFWHEFCDWYLEIVKPDIMAEGSRPKAEGTQKILLDVLENSLKLLHPFMPFVTEAVWQNIKERETIMLENWPAPDKTKIKEKLEKDMELIKNIIINIRNIRSDLNIPYSQKLKVYLSPLKKGKQSRLKGGGIDYIKNLARLEELTVEKGIKKPKHCATAILEDFNLFIPLEGVIDLEAEKARLLKKRGDLDTKLKFTAKRLKDKNFVTKAPENIVAQEKTKSASLKEQIERVQNSLKFTF